MDKEVWAAVIGNNESISFDRVEPLHLTYMTVEDFSTAIWLRKARP